MNTDADILGRAHANDVRAITDTDVDAAMGTVPNHAETSAPAG